ncbi:MAG: hypothetical protein ACW98U_02580 [Candidatus Thorarchaeota archaeon]|jgi:hypothetical protein
MTEATERSKVLRAIKKCLVNADEYFGNAMNTLDEIGKGSLGVGMTPLVGGYALKDPKSNYREALINMDSAEKALTPLIKRYKDGRVNDSHFTSERAMIILGDLAGIEYGILIRKLSEGGGRESIWYRLKDIRANMSELQGLIAEL